MRKKRAFLTNFPDLPDQGEIEQGDGRVRWPTAGKGKAMAR